MHSWDHCTRTDLSAYSLMDSRLAVYTIPQCMVMSSGRALDTLRYRTEMIYNARSMRWPTSRSCISIKNVGATAAAADLSLGTETTTSFGLMSHHLSFKMCSLILLRPLGAYS